MEPWDEITAIFNSDHARKLSVFLNTHDLRKFGETELLYHALRKKAAKCVIWFLQNGWDPNVRSAAGANLLFVSCLGSCAYQEMVTAGAQIEMSDIDWNIVYDLWKYSTTPTIYFPAIYKMLLLGLKLAENHPKIPPPCYDAYQVILAREAACRQACYTFIRVDGLPRDLVRWMLKTFILPSKREEFWSNLKLPAGFE